MARFEFEAGRSGFQLTTIDRIVPVAFATIGHQEREQMGRRRRVVSRS